MPSTRVSSVNPARRRGFLSSRWWNATNMTTPTCRGRPAQGAARQTPGMGTVQGMQFARNGSTLYLAARGEADQVLAITGFKYK